MVNLCCGEARCSILQHLTPPHHPPLRQPVSTTTPHNHLLRYAADCVFFLPKNLEYLAINVRKPNIRVSNQSHFPKIQSFNIATSISILCSHKQLCIFRSTLHISLLIIRLLLLRTFNYKYHNGSLLCNTTPAVTYPDPDLENSPPSRPSELWTALIEKLTELLSRLGWFDDARPTSPDQEAMERIPLLPRTSHTPTGLKNSASQAGLSQQVEEAQPEPPIPSPREATTHPEPAVEAIHPSFLLLSTNIDPPIIDLDDPHLQRNGRELETEAGRPTEPVRIPHPKPWRPGQSRDDALMEWAYAKPYLRLLNDENSGRGGGLFSL
jgi:hypothetical protein